MSKVHTSTFYILEGLNANDLTCTSLAVSFDEIAIIEFAKALAMQNNLPFHAFRVTQAGGVIEPDEGPRPTHAASATRI
jgi:hypothetical protein